MSSSHHHHHGRPPRDAAAEASAVRARLAWVRMARAMFIGDGSGSGSGSVVVDNGGGIVERDNNRPSSSTSPGAPGGSGGSGSGGGAGDRSIASQAIAAYSDILEELIADVAVEAHRAWKTGATASSSVWMFPGVNLEGPTPPPPPPPPPAAETAAAVARQQQQQQQQRAGGGGGDTAAAAAAAAAPPPPARVARVDAFGQPLKAASGGDVACPACGRRVAASRFAPHLEKCLGGGRAAAGRALRSRS